MFKFRTVVSIWSVVILATKVSACHTTDHITDVSTFMTYMVIRRHQSYLPNIDYINRTTPSIIVTNSIMIKIIQQHKGGVLCVVQSDISSSHIIWYLVSSSFLSTLRIETGPDELTAVYSRVLWLNTIWPNQYLNNPTQKWLDGIIANYQHPSQKGSYICTRLQEYV